MAVLGSRKGNEIVVDGGIARIIIVSKSHGRVEATIDSGDAELVAGHTWSVMGQRLKDRVELRAYTNAQQTDGRQTLLLHHVIVGRPPAGLMVDHINGIPLDNRRANLRFVTRQQNNCNRVRARGVTFDKRIGKWQPLIQCDGVRRFLGYFDERADAEAAYQKAKAERDAKVFGSAE